MALFLVRTDTHFLVPHFVYCGQSSIFFCVLQRERERSHSSCSVWEQELQSIREKKNKVRTDQRQLYMYIFFAVTATLYIYLGFHMGHYSYMWNLPEWPPLLRC